MNTFQVLFTEKVTREWLVIKKHNYFVVLVKYGFRLFFSEMSIIKRVKRIAYFACLFLLVFFYSRVLGKKFTISEPQKTD